MPVAARLRSPRITPAPGAPTPGEMYYDPGTNVLYWWSGTAWVPTGKGGIPGSSWVSALSAAPVLDTGMTGQIRAGRQITLADFTALGLGAPVALWSLGLVDGGGGGNAANDSSGNGRNLINKGPNVNQGGYGINGISNTCAQFTGKPATEALFISDLGNYTDQFRLAAGSWGCWSMTNLIGTLQPCVGKWGSAAQTRAYTLLVDATNVATTSVFLDGTNAVGSTYGVTNIADGRWHFLVGTYDGSTVRLYVDGVLEGLTALTGYPIYITANGPVNVGSLGADASTAASYAHNGYIDEAFITADVLTESQIRYLYCAKIPHTLAKVPKAVSLNVRRQRKGAPLVPLDFGSYSGFQPVRLYNFTGGSLADQGSGNVPLTNNGGALSVAGVDGAAGGAYSFVGSSSQSLSSTDAGLPISSNGILCYGCWMKTSVRAVMGVMGWAGASGNGERIIVLSDGTLRFDQASLTTQGPFIADGQWHLVVVALNTAATYARRQFFVDNRLVGSTTNYGSTSLGGANGFRIGSVQDGTSPFTGVIDGVFVTAGAFAQPTLSGLYAKGSRALPPSAKNPGVHIEGIDASNIYATFDTLDLQHQLDLLVAA